MTTIWECGSIYDGLLVRPSVMSIQKYVVPINRRRLTEEIVDQLVSLISSGKLKQGDRLPSERMLMKQLGVGRSSLREALASLSIMGVVTVRPGSGTYVTFSPEEFLKRPLSWGIPVGVGKVHELVEARRVLEEAIAGLAAEKASEAEIAEMRQHLAQMKAKRNSLHKAAKADMLFHIAMAKASHNAVLLGFVTQIRNLLRSWIEKALLVPEIYDLAIKEHSEILQGIESHRPNDARLAARKHIETVGNALASAMLGSDSSQGRSD